ncbi:MAG: N-acetylneuraminate lyase [Christensenellaceae bacterium]|nr:N-acetylneuraminate lyase [Christensenellaceae bacterium]
MSSEKYSGIIPALYACYDENNEISYEGTKALTKLFLEKGVKGLYVGGSSSECIYLDRKERKRMLEAVMEVARGKCTIIAHVACNSTKYSQELATHAESMGVDAIAAIPPIYFRLPDHAVAKYWNDISAAAPNTDFIIYNIPQLAGTALTPSLLKEMIKNPRVIGVKNSSMPVMDILQFKQILGEGKVVFNGPDEQLVSGLAIGADGGIGGTYGAMPELYIEIFNCVKDGYLRRAHEIQSDCLDIINGLTSCHGSMYAVIKEVIKQRDGLELGGVRHPMPDIISEDMPKIKKVVELIDKTYKKWGI